MHDRRVVSFSLLLAAAMLSWPVASHAQSFNGSVSGTVTDPSGRRSRAPSWSSRTAAPGSSCGARPTDSGEYAFRNLVPGNYELRVTGAGFQPYLQKSIEVALNGDVRLDVEPHRRRADRGGRGRRPSLDPDYDSGAHEDGIAPDTLPQLPHRVRHRARARRPAS